MKKLLILAVSAFVFCSCSDDDTNTNPVEEVNVPLQGTWKLTGYTKNTPIDYNSDGITSTNVLSETSCYDESTFVFDTSAVTWVVVFPTINGNTGEVINCNTLDPQAGTFVQAEDSIVLTIGTRQWTYVQSGNKITTSTEGADGESITYTKQ